MTNENEKKNDNSSCQCGGGCACSGPRKWIWIVLVLAIAAVLISRGGGKKPALEPKPAPSVAAALPRLVDLGAGKCIPCKMMAPILEELKTTYAGKLEVEFIDVWVNEAAGQRYGISVIPTQIFYDAAGKELFRHEGFYSKEEILAKWKELGLDLAGGAAAATNGAPAVAEDPAGVSRWTPAQPDPRPRESICYLCDGDIPSNSLVVIKTDRGDVRLCGMHHYYILYSALTGNKSGFEKKVTVADWTDGHPVPISKALFVYGKDATTERPTIKAFGSKEAALAERLANGKEILNWVLLQNRELANRCAFCDRAVYPGDAAEVMIGETQALGCCSHCALGVAARTGKDIEVRELDLLTSQEVVVKIAGGSVTSVVPETAVAWFGQRVKPDGTRASAGCFHQGFFATPENLQQWLAENPLETGAMITLQKALADKMALTPQQIGMACKIGECAPR